MSSDNAEPEHQDWLRTMKGNISQESKEALADWFAMAIVEREGFANSVARRLKATEANIYDKAEEPGKKEVQLVFEMDVKPDMINVVDNMHGGCSAFLIDLCSSMALTLLFSEVAPERASHVSLAINTVYHAPAPLGCRLKIVNSTVVLGSRVFTAKTEIFDKTHNRLVVSGVHVKMAPSMPKL